MEALNPHPLDVAKAAQNEADHLLAKLAEGYVTIGAGDPEAEIIRALVDSLNMFGQLLSEFMNRIGVAVGEVAELFDTATPDDGEA